MRKTKSSAVSGEYDPGKLFSLLKEQKVLANDTQLARLLEVSTTTISYIKSGKLSLSLKLLIRIQDVSGMSIQEMRDLMDDRRREIRMSELVESR